MINWTTKEDEIFMRILVESITNGETLSKAYENISKNVNNRSPETCSYRWYAVLSKVEENKEAFKKAKEECHRRNKTKPRTVYGEWTPQETETLKNTILQEISSGKKLGESAEVVSKTLHRTPEACLTRWNTVMDSGLRKLYHEARTKGKEVQNGNPANDYNQIVQHQISFDESEVESVVVEDKSYQDEIKKAEQFVNMYRVALEENAKLKDELEQSNRNNTKLIKENEILTKDVQAFAVIFDKARQLAINEEVKIETNNSKFKMERNGNLSRN